MNYGLYLSAAGTLTSLHKQDVHANNLANVNTVGFKPDSVFTLHRAPERIENAHLMVEPHKLLEALGGGQFIDPTYTNLKQGQLSRTDRALDLAIEGVGFFVISTGQGEGPEHFRLTRDGRFSLDADGRLVMAATGMPVLDVNNEEIVLDPAADVRTDQYGRISQDGAEVGQLQMVSASDPTMLRKVGQNLMRFREDVQPAMIPATGRIVQGHTEGSAVDPILTMNAMIGASKAAQSNAALMQYHDHIMGQAINTFGRVG